MIKVRLSASFAIVWLCYCRFPCKGTNNAESEAQDRENNALTEGKNEEAEDEGFHEVSTAGK